MKTEYSVEITGGDLVLIVIFAWLSYSVSPWLVIVVFLNVFGWFALPRWSRAEGWRFWR
jgi:ABC-type transport system involved in Fe-S cluster assembly fused permease/ATPase subunit